MSEPRRSTRARAREEAAPETPKETPVKAAKPSLKRKRASIVVKESTPLTTVTEGEPVPPKQTLPLKLVEGQPLPTLPEPQPLDLPSSEWQNIQQSGVLEASLERSRAVWTSGVNFRTFHKHFVQPKKVADRTDEDKTKNQRQKELLRNFPQIGVSSEKEKEIAVAQLVIEPHTFNIRLFGPREMAKSVPKKAPISNYGPWPNHSQHGQHSQPNQYTQYNNSQPVYKPPPQPRPPPPPPKPVQQAPAPATSTPAPDPVIHMLAARAGTDPELKAVMKIVANGSASKEQLEFFQTHINELTAILARQKEQAARTQKPAAPPPPQPKPLPPPPLPKPAAAPPTPRPVQPIYQPLQHTPKPYSPTPHQAQVQQAPHGHQSHSPYNYNPPQQYRQPQQAPSYSAPPPRTSYRPLVFEFTEGNNDKLYFPSYSFMEWLPNGSGVKISFLITKMKPKPEPAVKPPSTPAPKAVQTPLPTPGVPPSATPDGPQPNDATPTPNPNPATPAALPPAVPPTPNPTPYVPPPRIEDFDEKNDIADIEFYQPVTVLLLTDDPEIIRSLPRAVRPPDVVEKYMEEVFDKCKRAEETYLAFRLPKDGEEQSEKRVRSGDVTPAVATPTHDVHMGGLGANLGMSSSALEKKKAGRPRKSLV
ncbi:hypothetical protein N0V83_002799 [Neocucurbitaria cava]|uniref:SWR1-complex protein 3 domain-containing protein n=1 Tax=Neocucurbitaria cava TaxID=798079 RepID=A0A9W8YC74_9PLEO|nr:hypothetical protein N0V83_002799 [Neocucurbitaria cava]